LLLPLLDEMEKDALLYYYIAVAYRNIGIYQKAIYGDTKQAKLHLEIAKKIDEDDEILKDIERLLEGGEW